MQLSDFDYDLPPALIAQTPAEPRDSSRLLVLDREGGAISHHHFRDVGKFLRPGDVLVFNQTRVIPARLHGFKTETGGKVEFLLLHPGEDDRTWAGLIGGKGVRTGTELTFSQGEVSISGEVIAEGESAERTVHFSESLSPLLDKLGETPLPPYIHTQLADPERYQTVYARQPGSAAAPTAGLHFTPDLLIALKTAGVHFAYCTLHVGLDTFKPVEVQNISDHQMHSERAYLNAVDANIINEAKLAGGRIITVGTTSTRTVEAAALKSAGVVDPYLGPDDRCPWRPVVALDEATRLFIRPGYRFRAVDGIITNFHLPRSTLLMMISAFVGRERLLAAYAAAKDEGYHFYSFGDAMLIV